MVCPPRRLALTFTGLLTLCAIGTGAAAAVEHKTVTLEVEGESTQVATFASSVEDLIKQQNITVSKHDLVAPRLDQKLKSGSHVVVRHAKHLTLFDGVKETNVTTTALTASEAIDDFSGRADDAKILVSRSADRDDDAAKLKLDRGEPVVVQADGESHQMVSEGSTVGSALSQANTKTADDDTVVLDQAPGGAVKLVVTRWKNEVRTVTEPIPFETVKQEDPTLDKGTEKVKQEGKQGVQQTVTRVRSQDGKAIESTVLSQTVTAQPVPKIILVGTKEKAAATPPPASGSSGSSGSSTGGSSSGGSSGGSSTGSSGDSQQPSGGSAGLNWAALAQCESGGNPATNTGNGYYGMYQFSASTWRAVGGSGLPSDASAAEQTKRAQILYERAGAGQWPVCGPKLFS